MIESIKNILGMGPKTDLRELIRQGATIIDVRSKGEYANGHATGSINIPLDQLQSNLGRLKSKDHPIITCCASGMRSGVAKSTLKSAGYTNVHNGGSWGSVQQLLKS